MDGWILLKPSNIFSKKIMKYGLRYFTVFAVHACTCSVRSWVYGCQVAVIIAFSCNWGRSSMSAPFLSTVYVNISIWFDSLNALLMVRLAQMVGAVSDGAQTATARPTNMIYTSFQCSFNTHTSLKQSLPLCFVCVDVDINNLLIFPWKIYANWSGKWTSMKFCYFHCQLTQSLSRQDTVSDIRTDCMIPGNQATWCPHISCNIALRCLCVLRVSRVNDSLSIQQAYTKQWLLWLHLKSCLQNVKLLVNFYMINFWLNLLTEKQY